MTPAQQIKRLQRIQRQTVKAQKQTVSRVTRSTKTNLIRKLTEELSMKSSGVRRRLYVKSLIVNQSTMTFSIRFKPNQPNLRRFVRGSYVKPRGGRKGGLRAKVLGEVRFFEGAFWATMPNGKRLVFTSPRRGVLKAIRGPSSRGGVLRGNLQSPSMLPINFVRFARERFEVEWERALQRHLTDL